MKTTAADKAAQLAAQPSLEARLSLFKQLYPNDGWYSFWRDWGTGSPKDLQHVKQFLNKKGR